MHHLQPPWRRVWAVFFLLLVSFIFRGVVSAFAEPSAWCAGAVLVVAGCAVCASAAPSIWRIEVLARHPPPAATQRSTAKRTGEHTNIQSSFAVSLPRSLAVHEPAVSQFPGLRPTAHTLEGEGAAGAGCAPPERERDIDRPPPSAGLFSKTGARTVSPKNRGGGWVAGEVAGLGGGQGGGGWVSGTWERHHMCVALRSPARCSPRTAWRSWHANVHMAQCISKSGARGALWLCKMVNSVSKEYNEGLRRGGSMEFMRIALGEGQG